MINRNRVLQNVKVLENTRIFNDDGEEIFLAGQWAKAGLYRLLDSTRVVQHKVDGLLPASCDGHRAEYCRFEQPWINMNSSSGYISGH